MGFSALEVWCLDSKRFGFYHGVTLRLRFPTAAPSSLPPPRRCFPTLGSTTSCSSQSHKKRPPPLVVLEELAVRGGSGGIAPGRSHVAAAVATPTATSRLVEPGVHRTVRDLYERAVGIGFRDRALQGVVLAQENSRSSLVSYRHFRFSFLSSSQFHFSPCR